MHSRLTVFNMSIPSYGAMILLGTLVVTILGIIVVFWRKLQVSSFLKLELWGGIAAIIGSKFWYMIAYTHEIQKQNLTFNSFLDSGYSFYGGIFCGMIVVYISAKIFQINFELYAKNLIFLVPLFHAFWKMGCYMGGCCYGIRYKGIGALIFPEGVKAPAGIPLFPVQLLEAVILLALSVFFLVKGITGIRKPVTKYILAYSTSRFVTDFFRQRPIGCLLSIAQWVSILCIIIIIINQIIRQKYKTRRVLK